MKHIMLIMKYLSCRPFTLACLLIFAPLSTAAPKPPQAAIASAHPLATAAGMQTLAAGGNAFDAAVAVSAALAVVEPAGSGLGGGGFWLLHEAETGRQIMLDGRERAPLNATADMYLTAAGEPDKQRSRDGALAAGIPGVPAALAHLAEQYGELSLAENLAPAIGYAKQGFAVDERMRRLLEYRFTVLQQSPAAAAIFLPGGQLPDVGERIVQADLANTLEQLAKHGHAGFYTGPVAKALIAGSRAAGGIWQAEDLSSYTVVERPPIQFDYLGYRITSVPAPSSGGTVLALALQQLAGLHLQQRNPLLRKHLIVEAMRRAYRERAAWLGDSDYVDIPEFLTSADYAKQLRSNISPSKATASTALPPAPQYDPLGADTTHFSILDRADNRVAATLSINLPFGSGFMPPGTGVLLNDEMDDFSAKPGTPNAYGLVHGSANAIEPGKRMLSSMSPSFVESPNGIAILGTPGGSRIISMVLLGILNYVEGADAEAIVSLPRLHHQYLPDVLSYEPGALSSAEVRALEGMGHNTQARSRSYGNMQAITWRYADAEVQAASDPRGIGSAVTE